MAKTNYLETQQAYQLLRLIDNTDGLESPVCVEHRDKPDFVLSTRSRRIGLETSCFTDEEVMRADHLHFTRFPHAYTTTTGLRDGSRRRSNEEIAQTMFDWTGPWEDSIEGAEHVCRKIFESIRLKRSKFQSPDFAKFSENWLLLTDFLNPFSDTIGDEILARHLHDALQRGDVIGTEFDRVYIFYGPRCFKIQGGILATKLDRKKV